MPRIARIPISRVRLAILYSEQGGCCAGCFKPLGEDVHVDHVEPLARGGGDVFENLQLLHGACNQAKGTLGAAEWFARSWRAFLRAQKRPTRQKVTVALEHALVERLRLAAYWSRRSVTALLEEGAAHSLRAIEEQGGLMEAPTGRASRGRWVPGGGVPVVPRGPEHGDLFAE